MTLRAEALKPARNVGRPVVYILGTEDGSEVKIGYTTKRVSARFGQHQNANGNTEHLIFLAAVRSTQKSDERAIHRYFASRGYKSRPRSQEWFHATEEVRSWIRSLLGQPYTARSIEEADAGDLDAVDPYYWLPPVNATLIDSQLRLEMPHDPGDPWSDLVPDEMTEGDFYTHPMITTAARATMGTIDLDPASCTAANREVKARAFYGAKENGLMKEWHGAVWLNPPFGEWDMWAPKALEELRSGRTTQLCALSTSRASTTLALHPIVARSDALCIPRGRIPFWGPNSTSTPDEGHFIFYFGPSVLKFHAEFGKLGAIFVRGQS